MKIRLGKPRFCWLQCLLLIASVVVYNLLTNWINSQEGSLDIGLQLNLVMTMIYLFGVFLLLRGRLSDTSLWVLVALMALLGLSLFIRLGMIWIKSPDYNAFLRDWIIQMQQYDGTDVLAAEIGNYNVPYVYLLFLIAKLRPHHGLFYIKAASILFDLVMAYAASGLVGTCKKGRIASTAAFFLALALPTVVLNSAWWAQCDAIYTSLALLGLLFGLKCKSRVSFALFGFALSVKLQTVFLLPMAIILIICKRIRLRDCWVFFAAFFATMIPAILAGRTIGSLLSIYSGQMAAYPSLTLNAPSIFAWMPNVMAEMRHLGLGLAFMSCLGVVLYCGVRRNYLNNQTILEVALLLCLALPFFLPHMHERYYYCAEVMAVIYLFTDSAQPRWPVACAIWISGLFSYFPFLLNITAPISQGLVATVLALTVCCLAVRFVQHVEQCVPEADMEAGLA